MTATTDRYGTSRPRRRTLSSAWSYAACGAASRRTHTPS